jgi:hypothetical protein
LNGMREGSLDDPDGLARFNTLTKIHEGESKSLCNIATKLRMTLQSRYDTQKAHTAVKNTAIQKPWEVTG